MNTIMKKKLKQADPILRDVIIQIIERYEEGNRKYGGSMMDNHKSLMEWINEAQEEAIDLVVYLEKIKKHLNGDSTSDTLFFCQGKTHK